MYSAVIDSSFLTDKSYCIMPTGLHTATWEEWRSYCVCLEGANMAAAVSPAFLRTSACVITSVHHFISWGPIIMKSLDMCDA